MKNSIWVIWVMTAPLSTTSTAMCSSVCIGPLWWRCLDIIGGASAHGRGCCRWCLYCSGRGERCLLLSSWRSLVGQFTSILSIHYVGTHDNINSTSVAKTMMISSSWVHYHTHYHIQTANVGEIIDLIVRRVTVDSRRDWCTIYLGLYRIEEETYYTSNLNLLWVSSHHISPSTKEVEYEYIELIVHLRIKDMAYNAISLVTIDIVPTSQPLRHDKVVGDMQIVSISFVGVYRSILSWEEVLGIGQPSLGDHHIFNKSKHIYIDDKKLTISCTMNLLWIEKKIALDIRWYVTITHLFHMYVPYCLLRHHIRPITIIQKSIVQYKRLSSL